MHCEQFAPKPEANSERPDNPRGGVWATAGPSLRFADSPIYRKTQAIFLFTCQGSCRPQTLMTSVLEAHGEYSEKWA